MTFVWILVIAVVTFVVTISLVVVAQEVHIGVAALAFAAIIYGVYRLLQARLTRL